MPPLLYTLAEACEQLRLSEPTVRMLIASDRIKAIRVGRAVRVPRVSLERYIARELEQAPAQPGDR